MAPKTNKGVVDTKNMPGKPSGIVSAMSISSPLEAGVDISQTFGPDKPNPTRGSKTPNRSAQIPTQERTHKR
jgi:hypothetical protein